MPLEATTSAGTNLVKMLLTLGVPVVVVLVDGGNESVTMESPLVVLVESIHEDRSPARPASLMFFPSGARPLTRNTSARG